MRPVDVAEVLGCSTQLVRNLERDGVLPPARRTSTGYRIYTERHLHAALAYRSLSAGAGPVEAKRILRTFHQGAVPEALALLDGVHAQLHAERRRLRRAREATGEIAGELLDDVRPADALRISELADALGVRASTLRHWEAEGLLVTDRGDARATRTYSPEQVRDARIIHELRTAGHRIAAVRAVLPELRGTSGSPSITAALAAREATITARSRAMLEAAATLAGALP